MFRLSRLDPRTRIVMVISISTAAMIVKDLLLLTGILLFAVITLIAGGVELKKQLHQARAVLGMIFFLFILQSFFAWIGGSLLEGALLAGMLSLRLLIIVVSALIIMTGEPRDYLLGMVQWKMPYEIAYMVLIGLHFFPILKEEALDVYYSIQLRGTEMKKTSLRKKLAVYLKISLPVLAGAMARAKDVSISMEARCFRIKPKRTYMRKLKLKLRDILIMVVFPIAAVLIIMTAKGVLFPGPSFAGPSDTDQNGANDQEIVLSWTGEPSSTQTVSWHGKKEYGGILQWTKGEVLTNDPKEEEALFEENANEKKAEKTEVRENEYFTYSAEITGLKADTKYSYRVGDGKNWSRPRTFSTAPKEEENAEKVFSFIYMGDIQYELMDRDYKKWDRFADHAYRKNADAAFALFGGDMVVNNAEIEEYEAVMKYGGPMFSNMSIMTTPGNHETSIAPYTYKRIFSLPENGPAGNKETDQSQTKSADLSEEVYSFDYGDCHIVSLNSNLFLEERKNDMGEGEWQKMNGDVKEWLTLDLSESNKEWKIAFMHHPPWPVSEDAEDYSDTEVYRMIRENWVPIFEKYGIDLVLCGHQHIYMRTEEINGITYIMGRSGEKYSRYYKKGDPLPSYVKTLSEEKTYQVVSIKGNRMTVESFGSGGKRVDKWTKN